jgi:hypothetical protein
VFPVGGCGSGVELYVVVQKKVDFGVNFVLTLKVEGVILNQVTDERAWLKRRGGKSSGKAMWRVATNFQKGE